MTARKTTARTPDFEKSLARLEAIVQQLEQEEIPLDKGMKLFTEGQTLARDCEKQLKAAENRVRELIENAQGELEEKDLEPADDNGEDRVEGDADEPDAKPPDNDKDDLPF